MGSLFGSMSIALSALNVDQEALDVTSNNIANVNTPGYARQVAAISESDPLTYGNLQFGSGAQVTGVQSLSDQVLQFQIYNETAQQSGVNSFLAPMQQIQAGFNDASGTGLQQSVSNFFAAWSQLATNPTDVPTRQSVLTAGQNLASAFNSAAQNLAVSRSNLDQQVPGVVQQVNTLAQQIAGLNGQIANAQNSGQNAGTLQDQQTQLIQNLSQLVGVSVSNEGNGQVGISVGQGTALVVGGQSFALQAQKDPVSGMSHIYSGGTDITGQISGGQLGGTLQARDQSIPQMQNQLDTLASGIANAVNQGQKSGFDLNGNAGQVFFNVPGTTTGTAANISVNLTDPSQVAASQSGAAGDNSNALAISDLQNQNIVNGENPNDYYTNMVSEMGNNINSAQTESNTQSAVLQQLQNQLGSVSGVSLDEEAANLVKFQQAYQASAQVINVISQLTSDAINLGTGTSTT